MHTQYSLLDGANKIDRLVPRVTECGMPAVAMTDHGNMFGAVEFYKTVAKAGVKPLIGCEVYVAPGDRRDKQRVVRGEDHETAGNYHLILLAMNKLGYQNLCRLVTAGFTEGFYYKPRIDKELLRELNGGLIALSGCLASEVNRAIAAGSLDRARSVLSEYREIFDDRYYVEIQDNHLPEQDKANTALVGLAHELSLPLVATNDCHYLGPEDAHAHDVLLCIQTGKTMSDESRWRFGTDQLYVKSPEEMLQAFPDTPEAISNTVDIARRCDLELEFGNYQFPVFETSGDLTLEEELARDARFGLDERLRSLRKSAGWNEAKESEYRARLEHEIGVIHDMGFSGYFLIVADFTKYAKREGVPVGPGRGSAAGSLVAYALKITDLDPIPYHLLFERFLNPERKSMPDIDMDFCFERREEVIRYVREKYGEDHVAQIITFGTLKGKAAIKDVGRALDFTFGETDRIAKLYPAPKQGKDFPLAEALQMEPRLREIQKKGGRDEQLFDFALRLEGLLRHASKHAAGIVIGSRPLVEDLPLFVDKEGSVMTQFSGPHIEAIGLIKFDFLGLKTLTLLSNVVRRIREGRGIEIDLSTLPLDDRETYQLLTKADAIGVFQMESSGMRNLLAQLRPSTFEEIVAVLALFRPGPLDSGMVDQYIKRKHGKEEVSYPHPALKPILEPTYGVIVYQEQVMQIAQVLAGYSLGDADNLRRAMGKKDATKMKAERDRFIGGASELGVAQKQAVEIFDQMETFAMYGFNKSHSAAYALISYQTAYLKAHFPEEFLAGLLTLEMGDTDKTFKNIAECRNRGIEILPPNVNESREDFTVLAPHAEAVAAAGRAAAAAGENVAAVAMRPIRFGLGAVRGVGARAIESILATADADGPFLSLADFCKRTQGKQVNKKVVEGLIKCGAFDFTGESRRRLLEGLDLALQWAASEARDAASNQMGLFAAANGGATPDPPLPDIAPWTDREMLTAEREALGFYISGHPLDKYERHLKHFITANASGLRGRADQSKVAVGGVIQSLRLRNSRKGDRYASFTLEDKSGTVDVICWPETYRRTALDFGTDEPVCIKGTLEVGEERCQIIADQVVLLVDELVQAVQEVHFALRVDQVDAEGLRTLRATLEQHRGRCPAFLHLLLTDRTETVIELPGALRVAVTDHMVDAVDGLFGVGTTSFQ